MTADLAPGKPLRIVKLLRLRLVGGALGPGAARPGRRRRPWRRPHRLGRAAGGQRAYLDDFWERADVEIEGDAELQQAIRFGLFHTLQAGARGEQRAIAAKGLTGPGLRRAHVLGHRDVRAAGADLHRAAAPPPTPCAGACRRSTWRASAPRRSGCKGAAFPWRTIHGEECSSYWPAGTAAFHINADIADAVLPLPGGDRRLRTSSRTSAPSCWSRRPGCGARSATTTPPGHFRIDGVTGPDEYSAVADNNVYTNLMAQRNLRAAADAVERHPDRAAELGVDEEEAASWRDAAAKMVIPYDEALEVHPQAEGFTDHQRLGLRGLHGRAVPAAAALPLLRPVPQAGGQAGRPGAGAVRVRRRLHRRGEGPRLRVLRGAHRARLVAVGLQPGGRSPPRSATSTSPTTTSPRRR